MSELIRFETTGGHIVVETADEEGVRRVSRKGLTDVARRFGEVLAEVEVAAADALESFRSGRLRPDQIEIEFGVKLNAEAGALIAKTSTEGQLTVKLTWSSGPPPRDAG
ncbi:CU044_2847 family protein [Streptosporangium sp. NPDC001559]|uniref:CU044_2847 family protein n=1 Tax=unclassified Streptosporangium TaxID=2632669 RepID=UPI003442E1DF